VPGGARAVRLPALPPAMRGTLGGPLGSTGEITPAAAGAQDVADGIDDLAQGGRRQATTPLRGLRRKQVGKELPRQVASPLEGSGHGALLTQFRAL
jgi:hypothetical protein